MYNIVIKKSKDVILSKYHIIRSFCRSSRERFARRYCPLALQTTTQRQRRLRQLFPTPRSPKQLLPRPLLPKKRSIRDLSTPSPIVPPLLLEDIYRERRFKHSKASSPLPLLKLFQTRDINFISGAMVKKVLQEAETPQAITKK